MRSASRSASSRYWVVSSTVTPAAARPPTTCQTAWRPRGSRPVVGSSRKITAGRPPAGQRAGRTGQAPHHAQVLVAGLQLVQPKSTPSRTRTPPSDFSRPTASTASWSAAASSARIRPSARIAVVLAALQDALEGRDGLPHVVCRRHRRTCRPGSPHGIRLGDRSSALARTMSGSRGSAAGTSSHRRRRVRLGRWTRDASHPCSPASRGGRRRTATMDRPRSRTFSRMPCSAG
jgi:hypothetical protein